MTVVKGLDAIVNERPTKKQLDWIREVLGEEALDKVIMMNYSKEEVTQAIREFIERERINRQYSNWGVFDHSWGDDWG